MLGSRQNHKLILSTLYKYQVSLLCEMLTGGCRQKPGTFWNELSNEDILWQSNTKKIHHFIALQQHNFIAHANTFFLMMTTGKQLDTLELLVKLF